MRKTAMNDSSAQGAGLTRHPRRGFTLLEVLLSLSLVSFILVAVAMAIDINLRLLDTSRMKIEQAQLARAILHGIADDLRRAVVSKPPSPVPPVSIPSTSTGGSTSSSTSSSSATSDELSDAMSSALSSATSSGTSQAGFHGESDWIQFDVMRLPRVDQYNYQTVLLTDEALPLDRLSDVKTVLYSLQLPEEAGVINADGQCRAGLIRRELDRAVTLWSDEMGLSTETDLDTEPLAPEVSDLKFEYYDGTELVQEWNSDDRGGPPVAVLISLAITRLEGDQGQYGSLWSPMGLGGTVDEDTEIYRLLVHLPVSEPTTLDADSGDSSFPEL